MSNWEVVDCKDIVLTSSSICRQQSGFMTISSHHLKIVITVDYLTNVLVYKSPLLF